MDVDFKPLFYKEKVEAPQGAFFVDAFSRQIKELFFIEDHSFIGTPKDEAFESKEFKAFLEKKKNDYVYVYFPWNNHLVKTVQKEDYLKLKTNRNQDLITEKEQNTLRNYSVAVLGLSVGSNIAFVLTQAGISNSITIADFDALDTTNLNRILAGVHQIGLNKTIIAARKIYEDNPFAEIFPMQAGVSEDNLEEQLKEGNLNCLIDEVDNLEIKIKIRLLGIKYKIPVVMITDNGDGVVLHVERYDLGYSEIFGKPVEYWTEKMHQHLTKEEMGGLIMNDIVGGVEKVDPKMIQSVQRVFKKELVSWSQLGSAAVLGGVIGTVMIKHIALGQSKTPYIRAYINPEKY